MSAGHMRQIISTAGTNGLPPLLVKFRERLHADQAQQEARIANDIQRQHPDISRSEALRLAAGQPLGE